MEERTAFSCKDFAHVLRAAAHTVKIPNFSGDRYPLAEHPDPFAGGASSAGRRALVESNTAAARKKQFW